MSSNIKKRAWLACIATFVAASFVYTVNNRLNAGEIQVYKQQQETPNANSKLKPSGLRITPASLPVNHRHESLLPVTDTETTQAVQANLRTIKLQFASAVREADFVALNRFIGEEYGVDEDLDGLIVEGSRRLALSGRPEYISASFRALRKAFETALFSKNQRKEGKIVHIVEALGDHSSIEATKLLIDVLENTSLSRVSKGAAVQSLVAKNAKSAVNALREYGKTLKAQIDELKSENATSQKNEDLEFALDNYAELQNAIAILEN